MCLFKYTSIELKFLYLIKSVKWVVCLISYLINPLILTYFPFPFTVQMGVVCTLVDICEYVGIDCFVSQCCSVL